MYTEDVHLERQGLLGEQSLRQEKEARGIDLLRFAPAGCNKGKNTAWESGGR